MAFHDSSEVRFAGYVAALVGVIGHADRATPLRDYCTGLLMPAERKSVEPMAAITAPARVAAQHQSLLHFVGQSAWSDEAILTRARELTLPALPPISFPGRPERWWGDEALKAEADAPQATLEQRHQAAGHVLTLHRRGFFSAGALFLIASPSPVETAQ